MIWMNCEIMAMDGLWMFMVVAMGNDRQNWRLLAGNISAFMCGFPAGHVWYNRLCLVDHQFRGFQSTLFSLPGEYHSNPWSANPHDAIILYRGSLQEVFAEMAVHHGVIDLLMMGFGHGKPAQNHGGFDIPSCALRITGKSFANSRGAYVSVCVCGCGALHRWRW